MFKLILFLCKECYTPRNGNSVAVWNEFFIIVSTNNMWHHVFLLIISYFISKIFFFVLFFITTFFLLFFFIQTFFFVIFFPTTFFFCYFFSYNLFFHLNICCERGFLVSLRSMAVSKEINKNKTSSFFFNKLYLNHNKLKK